MFGPHTQRQQPHLEQVKIDFLNPEAAKIASNMVRVFWISDLKRRDPIMEPTDQYTAQGQQIMKKVGEKVSSPILYAHQRSFQMPEIGEPVMIPAHVFRHVADQARYATPEGRVVEAFTRDPDIAKIVKEAYNEGKSIPQNVQELLAQQSANYQKSNSIEDLSIDDLRAALEAKEKEEAAKSKSTSKSRSTKSTGD